MEKYTVNCNTGSECRLWMDYILVEADRRTELRVMFVPLFQRLLLSGLQVVKSPPSTGFMTGVMATWTSVSMRDQSNVAECADSVDTK